MKLTICDVCEAKGDETIEIKVNDGEHPHNGSSMYKDIDICFSCLEKFSRSLKLSSPMEYDDLKEKYSKR